MKKTYGLKRYHAMENAIQNTKHTNLRLGKRCWEGCGNQTHLVDTTFKRRCDEICHVTTTVNKQTQTVGITDGVTGANNSVLDVYKTIASAVHFHC